MGKVKGVLTAGKWYSGETKKKYIRYPGKLLSTLQEIMERNTIGTIAECIRFCLIRLSENPLEVTSHERKALEDTSPEEPVSCVTLPTYIDDFMRRFRLESGLSGVKIVQLAILRESIQYNREE